MATEIKSPTFPESVIDGTVANWIKKEGDSVSQDEVIAEIETDKVVLEVVAPFDGQILKIYKNEGEVVNSSEKIADFDKVELDKDHGEKTAEKVKDDQVTQSSDISEQQEKDIGKKVKTLKNIRGQYIGLTKISKNIAKKILKVWSDINKKKKVNKIN